MVSIENELGVLECKRRESSEAATKSGGQEYSPSGIEADISFSGSYHGSHHEAAEYIHQESSEREVGWNQAYGDSCEQITPGTSDRAPDGNKQSIS